MEQRPLRLGDLVDDYCPRERRVTNHAIVAIVNDSVRQTRCTTCDAEHVYRAGKPPRPRRKDGGAEPDDQIVDNSGGQLVTPVSEPELPAAEPSPEPAVPAVMAAASPDADVTPDVVDERPDEGWAAHRPLIRATLPRTEGDLPPPRPIPEFTMHQRHNSRGAQSFRHGRGWADRGPGGRNGSRGDFRGAFGQGSGNGDGNHAPGQGHGRRRHGRGKKQPR